jgi:hypothetical protein
MEEIRSSWVTRHILRYCAYVTGNNAAATEMKAAYLVTEIHRFSYGGKLCLVEFLFQLAASQSDVCSTRHMSQMFALRRRQRM